jgi:hypothetical protein
MSFVTICTKEYIMENMQARLNPEPCPWLIAGRVVAITVEPNVTAADVHQTLDRIFHLAGCPGCGLLGFDVSLLGDPGIRQSIEEIPGVKAVELVNR